MLRREQGYTVAMLVEEARILQVSIFQHPEQQSSHCRFQQAAPGRYSHRGRSRFAIETGNALLRGIRAHPVGGVGQTGSEGCGLGSASLPVRHSDSTPDCSALLGGLTMVVQRTSVKSELVSTFSSFRFPELSQPI
jgi:hypothetical protein